MKRALILGFSWSLGSVAVFAQSAKPFVLEHCDAIVGTVAINEPDSQSMSSMGQYGLKSPTDLLRSIVQDSQCFTIVERGAAMTAMDKERALAAGGNLQKGSNLGKGQLQAADFVLTPRVLFSQQDSGGAAGQSFKGAIGSLGKKIGVTTAELKFHEALTNMTVSDVRSGVQVATGDARASSGDLKNSSYGFQSSAFTASAEGKVVAESFLRSYSAMVAKLKARGTDGRAATGAVPVGFEEGAILKPKMGGMALLGSPKEGSTSLVALALSDRLLSLGEMSNGFLKVQRGSQAGWVRQSFLSASDDKVATAAGAASTSGFEVGSVVRPKIDNVRLLSAPKDGSAAVGTVKRSDDLVYLGDEKDGFAKVQGSAAEGWVKVVLLAPGPK